MENIYCNTCFEEIKDNDARWEDQFNGHNNTLCDECGSAFLSYNDYLGQYVDADYQETQLKKGTIEEDLISRYDYIKGGKQ